MDPSWRMVTFHQGLGSLVPAKLWRLTTRSACELLYSPVLDDQMVDILSTVDSALSIKWKDFHTQAQIANGNASNHPVTEHTPLSSNQGTSFNRKIASDTLSDPRCPH